MDNNNVSGNFGLGCRCCRRIWYCWLLLLFITILWLPNASWGFSSFHHRNCHRRRRCHSDGRNNRRSSITKLTVANSNSRSVIGRNGIMTYQNLHHHHHQPHCMISYLYRLASTAATTSSTESAFPIKNHNHHGSTIREVLRMTRKPGRLLPLLLCSTMGVAATTTIITKRWKHARLWLLLLVQSGLVWRWWFHPQRLIQQNVIETNVKQPQRNHHHHKALLWAMTCGLTWFLLTSSAAVASTTATTATTTRSGPTVSTVVDEQIVRPYVERHLFEDGDGFDVLADTYRERMEDATFGIYPNQLRQIISQTTTTTSSSSNNADGSSTAAVTVVLETTSTNLDGSSNRDLGTIAFQVVQILQQRLGVPQNVAMALLAGLCVVTPLFSSLVFGLIVAGISKRNMAKLFKQRYGENYSVDATLKPDPEEEDDTSLDADDDDDDDDDNGTNKDGDDKD